MTLQTTRKRVLPSKSILTCKVCKFTKSTIDFKRNGKSKTGFEYTCKSCCEFDLLPLAQKKAGYYLLRAFIPLEICGSKEQVIYALTDPRTNEVRYVGQTSNSKRRYQAHLYNRAPGSNLIKGIWIDELRALGFRPHMIILETIPALSAHVLEREYRWMFHFIQKGAQLTNHFLVMMPRLTDTIKSSDFDFLTQPIQSGAWYPLYCAQDEDQQEILKKKGSR